TPLLPALERHAGIVLEQLGRTREAVTRYRRYLAGDPYAIDRIEVEARVRRLEAGEAIVPPPPPGAVPPFLEVASPPPPSQLAAEPDAPRQPRHRYPARGRLAAKWWFWTTVGATVALAVGGAVIVSSVEEGASP
ncbi:MAG: hypothetical protein AAB356_08725, partial [Deltaproteobacteria bacterium]